MHPALPDNILGVNRIPTVNGFNYLVPVDQAAGRWFDYANLPKHTPCGALIEADKCYRADNSYYVRDVLVEIEKREEDEINQTKIDEHEDFCEDEEMEEEEENHEEEQEQLEEEQQEEEVEYEQQQTGEENLVDEEEEEEQQHQESHNNNSASDVDEVPEEVAPTTEQLFDNLLKHQHTHNNLMSDFRRAFLAFFDPEAL